jgi:hypothetical protein
MILAWLLLLTGLTISAVAIYYSVVGLTAIFSAAVIPIIIMGSALEVGKLVCASWLKANWERAPRFMKYYMITAVIVLMLITSMGIFGFLSKAHNDQTLVSGDVSSKIAIYDEKIKVAKENIDANRKALKQMDEAVDQVMGRSQDEKGADKAVALRRGQAKERTRLLSEITAEQKVIAQLSEERAPIAAEVRKVEAEVGPIKYIAKFIYGDHGADENMLERAVTWIILLIVVVFDPLAVIMLLAAQMTFGWTREQVPTIEEEIEINKELIGDIDDQIYPEESQLKEWFTKAKDRARFWDKKEKPTYEPDDGPLTADQIIQIQDIADQELPKGNLITQEHLFENKEDEAIESELDKWNKMIEEAEKAVEAEPESTLEERIATGETFVNSEGVEELPVSAGGEFPKNPNQGDEFLRTDYVPEKLFKFDGSQWVSVEESNDLKKKTYMIKDQTGQIQIKNRE